MQANFAGMESLATLRTGAEPVRGIMASKSGIRVFRRGGSGLASDPESILPFAMLYAAAENRAPA
jgi:hypothetical protein